MRVLCSSFMLLALSLSAGAQVIAPSGARLQDRDAAVRDVSRHQDTSRRAKIPLSLTVPIRVGLGAAGAVAGLFGGAVFGARVLYQGGCACEDPGLGEAIVGAAAGTVVGGALAAALPSLGSSCNIFERFGAGLLGSAVGALAGGAIGSAAGGGGAFLGYMVGAGTGSGLGAGLCKG